MVLEHELHESIPMHVQWLNYEENIYELEDHVKEKALNTNLLPKLKFVKKSSS
jgi:hypothetical protein